MYVVGVTSYSKILGSLGIYMNMNNFISVILPAYNEEDCILKTIDDVEAALKNAGLQFEIIVIDDGCTDRTVELAKERQVRILHHRRNFGVRA